MININFRERGMYYINKKRSSFP